MNQLDEKEQKKFLKEFIEEFHKYKSPEECKKEIEETNYNSPIFLKFYEEFHSRNKKESLLSELNEMALLKKFDNDKNTNATVRYYKDMLLQNGTTIGDQNGKDIVINRSGKLYLFGIKKDNEIVSFTVGENTKKFGKNLFIVSLSYTDEKFRQKGYIKQLYLWIKNNFKIGITDNQQQSPDAVELYNALSNNDNFHVIWYNTKSKEELPYDSKDAKLRSTNKKTDWIAIIEAAEWWDSGSGRNPYGHVNTNVYTSFAEDQMEEGFLEYCNLIEEKKEEKGTFVGVRFSKATIKKLEKVIKNLKVPNPIPIEELHSTVIYSTVPFTFKELGKINPPWIGIPKSFDIFKARDGNNCLVLKYECDEQKKRHEYLMKEYDAQYSFPSYKIHLTLSYNCGELNPKDYDVKDIGELIIDEEYQEVLDLDKYKK